MTLTRIAAAAALLCLSVLPAGADCFRPGNVQCDDRYPMTCDVRGWDTCAAAPGKRTSSSGAVRGDMRPKRWCGWYARHHLVSRDPGIAFNLARRWAEFGRAAAAAIGTIVVWPHHVGKIVAGGPGEWQVESGNDGGAVRTRVRSIAGHIALRSE